MSAPASSSPGVATRPGGSGTAKNPASMRHPNGRMRAILPGLSSGLGPVVMRYMSAPAPQG